MIGFGRMAAREVLSKQAAINLAARSGLFLKELGGSGNGIIGALAAVALRAGAPTGHGIAAATSRGHQKSRQKRLTSQKLPDPAGKSRQHPFPVADDAEAGYLEDIRLRVFIYGDNALGTATTTDMMAGTG